MARKNLLKGFKKPKGLTFEQDEANPGYGKFVAYPFETGFGTTVGNTLRRVLLSSIQGYAISAVKTRLGTIGRSRAELRLSGFAVPFRRAACGW